MWNAGCLSIFILAATFAGAIARELPEFLHICKPSAPNYDECIKESVEYLKPHLVKGEPEYNIPSLEPLLLKELVAAEGTGIRVTAKDVLVYGASDFSVTKLKTDIDNLRFALDVQLPNIQVEGMYEIDGKVLLLPIQGSGPMHGNFTNCKGAVKLQVEVKKNPNGEDQVQMKEFKMKISVGNGNLRLDNLFGGERMLGDAVNTAINSNFNAFLRELQPLVERALSNAFLQIADSIVSQFTYQQLFPQD